MSREREDVLFERLADLPIEDEQRASSRLKSKIYSSLIARMEESGPLQDVRATASTHSLCVFERLVQITPLGDSSVSANFCRVCHARILAEHVNNAPIYWRHCPYVRFQNR